MQKPDLNKYRSGAIAVLFDESGKVFVAERSDSPGSWQLPQGGVDPGEEPLDAVMRELFEETGILAADLDLLCSSNFWTSYDWPAEFKERMLKRKPECVHLQGACHQWFFFRYTGNKDGIDVTSAQDKEFTSSKWVAFPDAIQAVDPMRRDSYQEGFAYWVQQNA